MLGKRCIHCGGRFIPTTRKCKVCDECIAKHHISANKKRKERGYDKYTITNILKNG